MIPKLGLTMDDAHLVAWLKAVGDEVAIDEAVAEVETDKADAEVVSEIAGRIVELLVVEGDPVEPGQRIARIEGNG